MKRMHYAGLALAILASVGVTLTTGCGRRLPGEGRGAQAAESAPTPVLVATAMRGAIEDTLELTGTAQAREEVDVVPELGGKVTAVHADVGDYVRRGQVLVRLDAQLAAAQANQAAAGVQSARAALQQARTARDLTDRQTTISVSLAEAQLAAAREQLKKAEAAAQLTESTVLANIDQARTAVQAAETALAEVRAGARAQQRAQAQAAVNQAQAALELARQTYERHQKLFEGGAISQMQLDQVRTQYQVAQAQYEQAVQGQSLTEEGASSEQVRQAELRVQAVREALRVAEAAREQITIARHDVDSARQGVRQAEEALRAARANRDQVAVSERQIDAARAAISQAAAARQAAAVSVRKHAVYAPISGLVARRMVDPGEGAMPGMPVLRLVNINPIRLQATVSELDLRRISVGQRAVVSFDGLPDQQFLGVVREVAPQADTDSRNYMVRLEVSNEGGAIRPGMFARVQLVLDSRSDSILIRRDGLVERGRDRLVYVVSAGTVQVRQVTVGTISGNLVEILEGVREGESYIIADQSALAEGQKVVPKPPEPEPAGAVPTTEQHSPTSQEEGGA